MDSADHEVLDGWGYMTCFIWIIYSDSFGWGYRDRELKSHHGYVRYRARSHDAWLRLATLLQPTKI